MDKFARVVCDKHAGDPNSVEHHSRIAVVVLCAAGLVVALVQTIIVPLVPLLPNLLNASPSDSSWALTITLLVGAVATPIGGRLGDMYGKRSMLLVSLSSVTAGSAICALSTTLAPFLVGRAFQGLGLATIALGISVARDIVPRKQLGPAVGTISASLGIGGAVGLPFASSVTEYVGWHAVFWICAAAGVLVGFLIIVTVPRDKNKQGGRFDIVGSVGLAALLTSLLLPLSKGSVWGWTDPLTITLLIASVMVTIAWCVVERRHSNPLIDIAVATERRVLLTNIASVTAGFAFYSMQLIPIRLLTSPDESPLGLGLDMLTACLILAPSGLAVFLFSHWSALLAKKFGPRISLSVGGCILGGGYAIFLVSIVGPWPLTWPIVLFVNVVTGAGIGTAYASMPALIMQAVPARQTGEANGVNALMRVVGTALSAAVVGMILTSQTVAFSDHGRVLHVPTESGYMWAVILSLAASALTTVMALIVPSAGARVDGAPAVCNQNAVLIPSPMRVSSKGS
ncbi:MFS transporter [Rhodococcoides fascians]|uniref:MFS transporter n=1 Tax=Rhodococcoides fascians TaxID=1828 RepID=UPI0015C5C7B8|nr:MULTISPECIES: MFS transporter [Rhodococcus]